LPLSAGKPRKDKNPNRKMREREKLKENIKNRKALRMSKWFSSPETYNAWKIEQKFVVNGT
jgi:hypothetical protein